MKLMHYIAQVWGALTTPPTPAAVQRRLLREAELEYLKSLAAAEDHSVQMEAYTQQANMLRERIGRLSMEAARV